MGRYEHKFLNMESKPILVIECDMETTAHQLRLYFIGLPDESLAHRAGKVIYIIDFLPDGRPDEEVFLDCPLMSRQ